MNDDHLIEKPVIKCDDCGKLYLKFDHIPLPQPCPHCLEEIVIESCSECGTALGVE